MDVGWAGYCFQALNQYDEDDDAGGSGGASRRKAKPKPTPLSPAALLTDIFDGKITHRLRCTFIPLPVCALHEIDSKLCLVAVSVSTRTRFRSTSVLVGRFAGCHSSSVSLTVSGCSQARGRQRGQQRREQGRRQGRQQGRRPRRGPEGQAAADAHGAAFADADHGRTQEGHRCRVRRLQGPSARV